MATLPPKPAAQPLSRRVRRQFVARVEGVIGEISAAVQSKLTSLIEAGQSSREIRERREILQGFMKSRDVWVSATPEAWRKALNPSVMPAAARAVSGAFELIGNEVVENKILASRMALSAMEKSGNELNDLRMRIQHMENITELASDDVFRPEVMAQILVEQWVAAGLSREVWVIAQDSIQSIMVKRLVEAYREANEYLIQNGVLPVIDLKTRVRRSVNARTGTGAGGLTTMGSLQGSMTAPGPATSTGGWSSTGGSSGSGGRPSGPGESMAAATEMGRSTSWSSAASEETRMMTVNSPLTRARQRAQGVLGQLKRLLTDRVADFEKTRPMNASPALAEALAPVRAVVRSGPVGIDPMVTGSTALEDYSPAGVAQVAGELRTRTTELKKKASTSGEKATIEIVALMFQSILAEERIPPGVRVWFARLQMPVLRVALAEPEFFGTLQHPARRLIDHMGSCVMGFDASAINGSALEAEIRRVVQVIEQYPDTGRRVYQLVYDEFQKFLSKYLTEKGSAQRVVSIAQQVEQKETLAIQYTIELRNMLKGMPVRDEVRDFLFKVWAEVLAMAAVKYGPQHQDTVMFKRCAADLVWAASAKPNRQDRARVIQDLPQLLQRLRQGMTMLGVVGDEQEARIKTIGETLAEAFMSKTESIPQEQIDAMAKRLANLEDFVMDHEMGDLPLDAETIELMVGIDAASIEVVADGGSQPNNAMIAWAHELQPGTWYTLDHNNHVSQVQFVWRSERKQLFLFASMDGRSFLIQCRRLAAYLQAGLLVPQEEEALTVRATRDALAKLDANPERLLS